MKRELLFPAFAKLVCGIAAVLVLVFLPAGTFGYLNGWIFTVVLFVPMILLGIVLFIKKPQLLEKRLRDREKQSVQKFVIMLSAVMFISGFVICGLSFRFGFMILPFWFSVLFAFVFLFGYALYAVTLVQNEFLSRTVEVMDGQRVINTGLYGVVRHPMYLSTVVMFISIPLMLGSLIGFFVFLAYPFIIGVRIKSEEELLEKELSGYSEYRKKVKYRMIPFIW